MLEHTLHAVSTTRDVAEDVVQNARVALRVEFSFKKVQGQRVFGSNGTEDMKTWSKFLSLDRRNVFSSTRVVHKA